MSREFYNILAGISDKPVVNIQSFERIGDSRFYSVIFASAGTRDYSFDSYDSVIAEMTEEKLRIESGSLFAIPSNVSVPMFRAILSPQQASMEYTEENVKNAKLTPIHANVFADENDAVWQLIEGNRLVQVTEDDHDAILEAKKVRNPIVASFSRNIPVNEGDYVYFMNVAKGEMDFGFALSIKGRDRIFSRASNTFVDVEDNAVVEAADVGSIDASPLMKKIEMLAASEFDMNAFIDYMRALYGGSDMIKELEKAIRSNGVR